MMMTRGLQSSSNLSRTSRRTLLNILIICIFITQDIGLYISVSPKVHILESHIVDFSEISGEEVGLGFFSEQGFETMHHDFKVLWEKVKTGDISHEDFAERLLDCVCSYNAKHM
eukprot:TRINITY_DN41544_c0_g1_i1.p1 TRINITY_DN41544_c0_g1~~TRINITY_DN41544_c0_g1_i1.p1  ORF type:complete len:114 (-),score=20.05 TRINITY_DN41544_c0_g1_i1:59-400(-)